MPLKLYSTLQEDFTPVGAGDQDDEGMIVSMMICLSSDVFKIF